MLQHSTASTDDGVGSSRLAKPGCPDKCGNVSIPYPFGIGKACSLDLEGFQVYCHPDNIAILNTSGTPLLEINLAFGEARVQNYIARACNITESGDFIDTFFPVRRSFMVSRTKNIFTAIGCQTNALIAGDTVTPIEEGIGDHEFYFVSACGLFCSLDDTYFNSNNSADCSGRGCCQSELPTNLRSFFPIFINQSSITDQNFSQCSYAFISEKGWFTFHPSYVRPHGFERVYRLDRPPLVLDWVVGNASCEVAKQMGSAYACAADNSICIDVPGAPGYRCNCSPGYEGNPYLDGGCTDINECDSPSQHRPCINNTCTNTIGSYNCSCPAGTQSNDPRNIPCTPIPAPNNKQPQVKVVIGTSIGFVLLIVCISALLIQCQIKKLEKEKEKFFKQNGGNILYQQILLKQIDTVIIFTIEDLKKATNNYDRSRELGIGGHGTVYKGILDDNKVVAVKRSKIMNVVHAEEFVQVIIILSQLNHRNVVRLLGCCLEVEVPILVYEYIPNGTLFQLIHENRGRAPVSLEDRLRIAQESAEALEYLHLSINRPIVHGDVKSLNILLDDKFMAKVTDFGASRILPKDEVQLMTMVQGTLGYLDPEYLQERKLTEKSDVYSFGVVLLELITRKTAIYYERPGEGKNLASSFLEAMKGNRVGCMLDSSIMAVGMEELFQEVAELASGCLSLKGDERPSMTQVADKLTAIRSAWREALLLKHEETQNLTEKVGLDSSICELPPSSYWTARILALNIETPHVDPAGTS